MENTIFILMIICIILLVLDTFYIIMRGGNFYSFICNQILMNVLALYVMRDNLFKITSKQFLIFNLVCIGINSLLCFISSKIDRYKVERYKKGFEELILKIRIFLEQHNLGAECLDSLNTSDMQYKNYLLNKEKWICKLFDIPKTQKTIDDLKLKLENIKSELSKEYKTYNELSMEATKYRKQIEIDTLFYDYYAIYSEDRFGRHCSYYCLNAENIEKLINYIEKDLDKIRNSANQRKLMTSELRKQVLERDNYTCCQCGNSIYQEPNLLLEVDHIIPVSKGGVTELDNLQTLCWKCNRSKSAKV